jgi:hypothetical protein
VPIGLARIFGGHEERIVLDADGISSHSNVNTVRASWTQVRQLVDTGSHIIVRARGMNTFTIPNRAFTDQAQRQRFCEIVNSKMGLR